jgi:sialidase-1
MECEVMEEAVVFGAGENGVPRMRIPGLAVSKRGTLLAFCEARDAGDRSPTDLVLKRSDDGGASWGPLQLVVKAQGTDAIMNPCPVVDASDGAVYCFSNIFPGGDWESHRRPGAVRTLVSKSTDEGLSWSAPVDVTEDVIDTTSEYGKATGPGAGIQTSAGRLIVPLGLGPEDAPTATIIYSDDHGATWHSAARTPVTGSETQVVELADGGLRLDMRNQRPEEKPRHCRYFSVSKNAGETWTAPVADPGVLDVRCQGSIIRHPGHKGLLLFANPASTYKNRVNMTVRLSRDDGESWLIARTVYPGPCAYSCLAALADGAIGLLYENGDEGPYERISFARMSLEWLTEKDRQD